MRIHLNNGCVRYDKTCDKSPSLHARPVTMTVLAAHFAMIPTALALGEANAPRCWAQRVTTSLACHTQNTAPHAVTAANEVVTLGDHLAQTAHRPPCPAAVAPKKRKRHHVFVMISSFSASQTMPQRAR
jgi:hypothetical protein